MDVATIILWICIVWNCWFLYQNWQNHKALKKEYEETFAVLDRIRETAIKKRPMCDAFSDGHGNTFRFNSNGNIERDINI